MTTHETLFKLKAQRYGKIEDECDELVARLDNLDDSYAAHQQAGILVNIFAGRVMTITDRWQGESPAPDYDDEIETIEDDEL